MGGFKAQVTMMGSLLSDRVGADGNPQDLTDEARDGLIIAVPMYNPKGGGTATKEGWIPLYGSTFDGFQTVEVDADGDDEAYRRAVLEAALKQFANPKYEEWHLHWNNELDRYEGTLNDLPGSVERYVFVNETNGNVLTAYYLLDPKDSGLFDGCATDEEKCKRLAELAAGGDIEALVDTYQSNLTLLNMDDFNRQFYSRLYIPNKARKLLVQKQDENGNPLVGAVFTLYDDENCTSPVAQGITDDKGFISFSVQNTGNNVVTTPTGGLSSKVHYPLAQYRDEATGRISEKKLWLKETTPPAGYELNPTVTEVLITNDYLYANAGTLDDDVRVARGLGYLVETMVRYASDGAVNITLRDITATGYKYTGKLDAQGFPTVGGFDNWTEDTESQPLNLHYGLGSSLLDYGLHEGGGEAPAFVAEEGWYGIGVKQNFDAHSAQDDPYYKPYANKTNLIDNNVDISALFTGSTVIIYQDKTSTPDPNKGNLQVTKYVTGSRGDYSQDFPVEVKLSDKTISGRYGDMTFWNGVSSFTLRDNESSTAIGLPAGIAYTVTETNAYGHSVSYSGRTGTIPSGGTAYAVITNHKTGGGDRDEDDDEKIDVTVKKVWRLDDGGKRTESVRVELLRNGEHDSWVTLSEENHWSYVWRNLDDSYSWSVREVNIPDGFTSTVERSGMNFTITNDDKPDGNKPEPEPTVKEDAVKLPKLTPNTGDERAAKLCSALAGISLAGLAAAYLSKKKR